jgi:hypothetical protein
MPKTIANMFREAYKRGFKEGCLRALRCTLLDQLEVKFGKVPASTRDDQLNDAPQTTALVVEAPCLCPNAGGRAPRPSLLNQIPERAFPT